KRPIAGVQELGFNYITQQQVFATAEQIGNVEHTHGGQQHHQATGHYSGRSQRQGDAPEALESVGSQVPCRLQKAQVQLLQSGVEGQNHKGQEYVTQTQDHGKLRVQQLQGLLDNAQLDQAGVNQAAVAENKLQCVG